MRKSFLFLITILLPIYVCATGRAYVYPDYPIQKIQQIIDESDHIIFRKGVYNVDDNTSWFVKSNKKLTFESGSRLDFTNTRAMQYESLFNIQGDNVVFEGLCFTSSSRCSRSVYGNGPRDGFSSLCTVIMIRGNNVKVLNSNIKNAEIAVSISSGNNIEIKKMYGECAQTIFATRCENLTISNVKSLIKSDDVGDLDHHIYLKAKCSNVNISDCEFIGGPSYAIQISGDYSDPYICPRNVDIRNVSIEQSKRGLCVDMAHSDVRVSKMNAVGLPSPDGDSFFLANRGGCVNITRSVISNYNYVELETLTTKDKIKGHTSFYRCSINFSNPYVCAFSLYYLDTLSVKKCSIKFYETSLFDGFIARTNPQINNPQLIEFINNDIYISGIGRACYRIPTDLTEVYINKCRFYNFDSKPGIFISNDTKGNVNLKENKSFGLSVDYESRFSLISSRKLNKAYNTFRND